MTLGSYPEWIIALAAVSIAVRAFMLRPSINITAKPADPEINFHPEVNVQSAVPCINVQPAAVPDVHFNHTIQVPAAVPPEINVHTPCPEVFVDAEFHVEVPPRFLSEVDRAPSPLVTRNPGMVEILDPSMRTIARRPLGHRDVAKYLDTPGYRIRHSDGTIEDGTQ